MLIHKCSLRILHAILENFLAVDEVHHVYVETQYKISDRLRNTHFIISGKGVVKRFVTIAREDQVILYPLWAVSSFPSWKLTPQWITRCIIHKMSYWQYRFSPLRSENSPYLSSLCRLSCASRIRQSSPTLLSLYFWARSRIFMALSSVLGSSLRKLAHRSRTVLIWYSSASLSKCSTFSTKTSNRINFTFNHVKMVDSPYS